MREDNYQKFLASKRMAHAPSGFDSGAFHGPLFPFQQFIVDRALRMGKMAVFADCGMGKTLMQLEWAHQVHARTGRQVIVAAPLAVGNQSVAEAIRFGYDATFSKRPTKEAAICITNYDSLHHFDAADYAGIVADESSILKGQGAMRRMIQDFVTRIPYRLACTATPAPNDYTELGNHSEFVGGLSSAEMLASYFVHDGGETSVWRLKGHARRAFWHWVASWSVFCAKPSDLGFNDEGYDLPPLRYHHHQVGGGFDAGLLFDVEAESLTERRDARRASLKDRCEMAASLVNESDEPWLVWCDLNAESELLDRLIPSAIEVQGSHKDDYKSDALIGFAEGRYTDLISKPTIAGFGMNYQHCSNMAFVGLSDSWEQIYQAVRRSWRFGQVNPVNAHVITSLAEGAVVRNIQRKDANAKAMAAELSEIAREIYAQNR